MTERVSFSTKSGATASGELVLPPGNGKAPAVVLVQEWWGLNDHIRSLIERLAAAGFVALAPDLFHGKTTKDAAEAGRLMQELDKANAVQEIGGAVRYLETHPRSSGKVGIIGFCLGGALTFAAAANIPELAAAVPFYGLPGPVDWSMTNAVIQAHFAKRDDWAKASSAEAIKKELEKLGKSMELHVYDADHAFVNDTRPEVYSEPNAKLAWDRAIEFLRKHLAA